MVTTIIISICLYISPLYPSTQVTRLMIMRPRSRNLERIFPVDSWTLPITEFSELLASTACHVDELSFHKESNFIYTVNLQKKDITCSDEVLDSLLIESISESILVHSLHESVDSISITDSAVANSKKWFVSTIIIGDAYCSTEFIENKIIGNYNTILAKLGEVNRVYDELKAEVSYRVIYDKSTNAKQFFLTKQIARGMGSSLEDSRSLREMLPAEESYRRPNNGLLKSFALSKLPHRVKTALEPEVALLMCSFAKLSTCTRVLDPFCGSSNILLAAAKKKGNMYLI
jgi:hypothetical protein